MKYKTWLIGGSWLTCLGWLVAASGTAEELQLTLPPVVYAVPNLESAIYFDNIVLTQSPGAYRFDVTCDLGTQEATRWTVTPSATR